jgi:DNA processing protein
MQTVSAQSLAPGKSAAADIARLSMDDPSYPPRLKEIDDPPLIPRARGDPEVLTKPDVAMVGTPSYAV